VSTTKDYKFKTFEILQAFKIKAFSVFELLKGIKQKILIFIKIFLKNITFLYKKL